MLKPYVPLRTPQRAEPAKPADLKRNEITLAERQALTRSMGRMPVSRAEAERVGYPPEQIRAWFGRAEEPSR